jgi:AcrR family transcriptional regulator
MVRRPEIRALQSEGPRTNGRIAEDFFRVGLDILAEAGFPSLTAVALCARLGVTRGSFYHHFSGLDDFNVRLLEYWEHRFTYQATAEVEALKDESDQRRLQLDLAAQLPHAAEAAIRAWSLVDPRVALVQQRVDRFRVSSTVDHLRRHGLSSRDAQTYADIAVSCLVGLQLLDRPADRARVRRTIAEIQAQIESKRRPQPVAARGGRGVEPVRDCLPLQIIRP